uniref:hypothetical protein n=1 Tax=uncultured Sphingomonas sp. TaxID=158754 RepID=UPI0035CBD875
MADTVHPHPLSLPLALFVAGIIGILTAAMFALVPTELLESMVVDSGIASVLSAAEPPLGLTARAASVLLCGGGVGLVAWFGLFLSFGSRTIVLQRRGRSLGAAPVLRRADAHPDAPARRPLFANTDLGTPFLEVRARPVHLGADDLASTIDVTPVAPRPPERALPDDLDQPLSAYDPAAVPDAPLEWAASQHPPEPEAELEPEPEPRPLPRRQTFDAGERFETFPLTPPAPADSSADPASSRAPLPIRQAPRDGDPSDTIHALLDRLERVVSRRDAEARPAPAPETIEDTLSVLRRMETNGN